mgnify:CR=1 FL=1
MAMASIDSLAPTRSLIDLTRPDKGDFGLDDYELSFVFDDILLIEYVDETETKYVKEGDIVIFPNNMGVSISNINVTGKGKVKKGIFLNEERMFGICKRRDDSTKSST